MLIACLITYVGFALLALTKKSSLASSVARQGIA